MGFDDIQFGNIDFGVTQDNFNAKFYVPSPSDCMRCGLCLSSCPTYSLFQNEAETPRQRIRTIHKILNENQSITMEERFHLDNCLQCRACEPVCPSKMAYGELFNETQRQLTQPLTVLTKIAFWLIEHKQYLRILIPILALYLKSGIRKPLQKSRLLQKLGLAEAETLLTNPALQSLKVIHPSKTGAIRGRVGLFIGCLADHFDRATIKAAIELLTIIGFEVVVPLQQCCCGAIHQHNGQSADRLIANNIQLYNSLNLDAVIFIASGCGSMLSEYKSVDNPDAKKFGDMLTDINDFLLQHWPEDINLKPANKTVAVHEPCSQRNLLKNEKTVYKLLAKISGLNLIPLPDNHQCCGAGGSYMLTHPDNANALRARKIEAIGKTEADIVVTTNFGCAFYLETAGLKIKHPAELLLSHIQ